MGNQFIEIRIKGKGKKTKRATIDVTYGDAFAKEKIKEMGDTLTFINSINNCDNKYIITVSFFVYNNISNTFMEMFSYYADEKKLVTH
jgi:hypothetical protein